MSETSSESIWIVTDEPAEMLSRETGSKNGYFSGTGNWGDETGQETTGSKGVAGAVKVSTQKLEQEMTHFLQVVGRLFNSAEQQAKVNSGMQLAEIELSVEISGEGEVKLIGNGAKASGKGAIKLTFKRQDSK
ncbi:Pepco domain-containing protein [Trichormus variabilis]|uniref:Pepco domain-containing protein n=1 Tax=Trichormus variabilis SAG 1403-4b TaxID=447716 RepID=A0A3S1CVQ7_ANAVA|nr:hypothetical protein [Trichormus variabilis]MBD2625813.1 hypothetical protein [Trichormus variabilis FACHB-164]RUS99099.1 hypothetical protein DSM107003_11180 [Trichormus variabilis SAG 1403-4b]